MQTQLSYLTFFTYPEIIVIKQNNFYTHKISFTILIFNMVQMNYHRCRYILFILASFPIHLFQSAVFSSFIMIIFVVVVVVVIFSFCFFLVAIVAATFVCYAVDLAYPICVYSHHPSLSFQFCILTVYSDCVLFHSAFKLKVFIVVCDFRFVCIAFHALLWQNDSYMFLFYFFFFTCVGLRL